MTRSVPFYAPPPKGIHLTLDVNIDLAEAARLMSPSQLDALMRGVALCLSLPSEVGSQ